jgi:uncharacterized ferredoxin-like protein
LDNRIFQKVGIISQKLLIMDSKLAPILAIAVSSSGKNIFFDRKKKSEAIALNVAE